MQRSRESESRSTTREGSLSWTRTGLATKGASEAVRGTLRAIRAKHRPRGVRTGHPAPGNPLGRIVLKLGRRTWRAEDGFPAGGECRHRLTPRRDVHRRCGSAFRRCSLARSTPARTNNPIAYHRGHRAASWCGIRRNSHEPVVELSGLDGAGPSTSCGTRPSHTWPRRTWPCPLFLAKSRSTSLPSLQRYGQPPRRRLTRRVGGAGWRRTARSGPSAWT